MALKNFISNIQGLWEGTYDTYNNNIVPSIISGTNATFNIENAESISTVFTCIKILAETMSRMPLNVYSDKGEGRTVDKEDYRYSLLHYNPNAWTSSQTFFSALEYWRSLKGNSFARIYRTNGKVSSLVLIPPSNVIGYGISNGELYYNIKSGDVEETINSSEILHFKGLTKDGIWGISNLEALRLNLSASYQGLQTIEKYYKNNLSTPKFIKSTISGNNQKAMVEAINDLNTKYAGSQNAGTLVPLPPNTELIDCALNFADAELISTLKYNTTTIAALYGIPAHMVGILEATKFNNVEMMALDLKSNTIGVIARSYRQELESKLLTTQERLDGISIEFATMSLVEMDSNTRINNLRTLANLGVISINDIAKLEGYKTYPEGDAHYIPGNYLTVEQIGNKPITPAQK